MSPTTCLGWLGRDGYLVKIPDGTLQLWLDIENPRSADITWVPAINIVTALRTIDIALADIKSDGMGEPTNIPKKGAGITMYFLYTLGRANSLI